MDFIAWLSAEPLRYLTYAALAGLCAGSFLNVVAYRLPRRMRSEWERDCREFLELDSAPEPDSHSDLISRSRCPRCHAAIRPWHNLPVMGWLILRGKCADCGGGISPRYPLIEALTGLLSLVIAWRYGATLETLAALAFVWVLLALTLIDLDEQILPDVIVYPLLWGGLLLSLLNADLPKYFLDFHDSLRGLFFGPEAALTGAIFGYLFLWLPSRALGLILRKETLGQGDLKLLAAIGAWIGIEGAYQVVMVAVCAALFGFLLTALLPGRDHRHPLPFGPFLALGALTVLLTGAHFQLALPG